MQTVRIDTEERSFSMRAGVKIVGLAGVVLFLVSASSTSFLNALQSETQYQGTGVYTNCSGWVNSAWIRDYPSTNYYLWPDVFTTYASSYVSNLLSDAVIYSTPAAGNNYNQYVAVRVSGTGFEVWH